MDVTWGGETISGGRGFITWVRGGGASLGGKKYVVNTSHLSVAKCICV